MDNRGPALSDDYLCSPQTGFYSPEFRSGRLLYSPKFSSNHDENVSQSPGNGLCRQKKQSLVGLRCAFLCGRAASKAFAN